MKANFSYLMSTLLFTTLLSACTNNLSQNINSLQEVQKGRVVSVEMIVISPEPVQPRGNIGLSVGSGGHSGIYGAVDIVTLASIVGLKKKNRVIQKIIVKRNNGTLVSVTQPSNNIFKKGDLVKIVQQKNEARVIH